MELKRGTLKSSFWNIINSVAIFIIGFLALIKKPMTIQLFFWGICIPLYAVYFIVIVLPQKLSQILKNLFFSLIFIALIVVAYQVWEYLHNPLQPHPEIGYNNIQLEAVKIPWWLRNPWRSINNTNNNGVESYYKNKYDVAILQFQDGTRHNIKLSYLYNNLGCSIYGKYDAVYRGVMNDKLQKEFNAAQDDLNIAIRLRPNDPIPKENLLIMGVPSPGYFARQALFYETREEWRRGLNSIAYPPR